MDLFALFFPDAILSRFVDVEFDVVEGDVVEVGDYSSCVFACSCAYAVYVFVEVPVDVYWESFCE